MTLLNASLLKALTFLVYMTLPSYTLGSVIMSTSVICSSIDDFTPEATKNLLYDPAICMLISGFIYWFILILLESKKFAVKMHQLSCKLRNNPYQVVSYILIFGFNNFL